MEQNYNSKKVVTKKVAKEVSPLIASTFTYNRLKLFLKIYFIAACVSFFFSFILLLFGIIATASGVENGQYIFIGFALFFAVALGCGGYALFYFLRKNRLEDVTELEEVVNTNFRKVFLNGIEFHFKGEDYHTERYFFLTDYSKINVKKIKVFIAKGTEKRIVVLKELIPAKKVVANQKDLSKEEKEKLNSTKTNTNTSINNDSSFINKEDNNKNPASESTNKESEK